MAQVGSTVSRYLFGGAITLCSMPAAASDLTGNIAEPEVVEPPRIVRDTSAFYVGASGGYAFGESDRFGLRTPTALFPAGDNEPSGGFGGVRAGWRGVLPTSWGSDYIYGLELGYDFGTFDDSSETAVGLTGVQSGSEISDVFSVRLRGGLTNRSGRVLYFASIGYVEADITTTAVLTPFFGPEQDFGVTDSRSGYSASVGAEYQISRHLSLTGEFEFVQFDSKTVNFDPNFSTRSTPEFTAIRIGLNYAF